MNFAIDWLGRLNWQAFQHNLITDGGVATMVLSVVAVIAVLTYFKRWRWLWREWLTTVDPKKIGVMYIIVAWSCYCAVALTRRCYAPNKRRRWAPRMVS